MQSVVSVVTAANRLLVSDGGVWVACDDQGAMVATDPIYQLLAAVVLPTITDT